MELNCRIVQYFLDKLFSAMCKKWPHNEKYLAGSRFTKWLIIWKSLTEYFFAKIISLSKDFFSITKYTQIIPTFFCQGNYHFAPPSAAMCPLKAETLEKGNVTWGASRKKGKIPPLYPYFAFVYFEELVRLKWEGDLFPFWSPKLCIVP